MARSTDQPPPDRARRKIFSNPFLWDRATVPAYKIRLREKRVLWLVGIALALAGLGALLGARLLSKPRQMRITVKADLRVLDARLWDTVSCLGGSQAKTDGSDLAARIVHRSLRHRQWPTRVAGCRRASALLLSTSSAIIASASAAPGRLSDKIRTQYRAVLAAASQVHLAVSAVADEALAGHRIPDWERCVEASRAVGRFQTSLSRVERSAEIHHPRSPPKTNPPPPPNWADPARLGPKLRLSAAARLVPLSGPDAAALLIPDPDSRRNPLLLLDPFGQARVLRLQSPVSPPPSTLRWLDLITPASSAFAPGMFWAYASFDARTGRGKKRLLLALAPRGLAAELALFVSGDGGRTYAKPVILATDAHPQGPVRLVKPGPNGRLLLTYAVTGGGFAVVELSGTKTAPGPRVVVDTGPRRAPPPICARDKAGLYLAGGDGQLWVSDRKDRRFRTVDQPQHPGRPAVALACLGGRAALVKQVTSHRFDYYTCGPKSCTAPRSLSWSRVERVQLTTSAKAVVILVAGKRTLFSRRDSGAAGKPGRPAAVTRWRRAPRDWRVTPGPNRQRLGLLLLDSTLRRLRTADGGKRWRGE